MYKLKKLALIYFIITSSSYSQNLNDNHNFNDSIALFDIIQTKNLHIEQSEKIKKMTTIYNNLNGEGVNVFKIQLNSLNNSRISAQNDSLKYENLFFPDKIEVVYEVPYFKSKTTYFLRKITAEKKLKAVERKFKNAFIVQETIDVNELNFKKP
tara:strand:- start:1750 stop:2211 length:462 start_codon:yes stop_codon:yes gene_type:complete